MIMKLAEVWSNIEGYEGYQASSLGKVRQETTGEVLKPSPDRGFVKVRVKPTGQHKKKYVHAHILIAKAFLDAPKKKMKVMHLNNKKDDNRAENLRYATQSYLVLRAAKAGRKPDNRGSGNGRAQLSETQVLEIRNTIEKEKISDSSLAERYGVSKAIIYCIRKRKTWTHI